MHPTVDSATLGAMLAAWGVPVELSKSDQASPTQRFNKDTPKWPAETSSVMLRNIACRFTADDVVHMLNGLGLQGKYYDVRVPTDTQRRRNRGYAFVDFISPQAALQCKALLDGRVFASGHTSSAKVCVVAPAREWGVETDEMQPTQPLDTSALISLGKSIPLNRRLPEVQLPKPSDMSALVSLGRRIPMNPRLPQVRVQAALYSF